MELGLTIPILLLLSVGNLVLAIRYPRRIETAWALFAILYIGLLYHPFHSTIESLRLTGWEGERGVDPSLLASANNREMRRLLFVLGFGMIQSVLIATFAISFLIRRGREEMGVAKES